MINYTLGKIAKIVHGELLGDPTLKINGAGSDSRSIKPGQFFVPLIGERFDGHDFVKELLDKGIAGSFWQYGKDSAPDNGNIILVEDSKKALDALAMYYRQHLNIKVVGVTGSAGKTSTKDLVSSVLSTKYKVHKTFGNRNNPIGLPFTLLDIDEDVEIAVIEMGIVDFGEMDLLADLTRPDYTVITGIAPAHIMAFKTMDNIVAQKCLVNKHNHDGICFYNHDAYGLERQLTEMGVKHIGYGYNDSADITIKDYSFIGNGMVFHLSDDEETYKIPLAGKHQILNATAAILVGRQFGLSVEEIKRGLENVVLTPHRQQLLEINNLRIIDDTYNSNPMSLKASLEMLLSYDETYDKYVCLGDMKELGDEEARFHAEIADNIDFSKFKGIYLLGQLMKNLHDHISDLGIDSHYYEDREALVKDLKAIPQNRSIILFKASNSMRFMDLIAELEA